MRQAISVPRANLISLGICLGKFSKTEKFRLHVTALDILGRYAKNKVRSSAAAASGDKLDFVADTHLHLGRSQASERGANPAGLSVDDAIGAARLLAPALD